MTFLAADWLARSSAKQDSGFNDQQLNDLA